MIFNNNNSKVRIRTISDFLICILFMSLLSSCNKIERKEDISKLMEYNGEYVGNASAIGNILTLLKIPYSKFELNTSGKPYGIQILCTNQNGKETNEKLKQFNLYCSTIIFSLIKNADEINFIYESGFEYSYKRKDVNNFFGQELGAFGDDKDKWEKEILQKLDSRNTVDSYYKKYTKINNCN